MQRFSLLAITAIALALSGAACARGGGGHSSSSGSHYVAPHTTKNGTYVQGHYQSNPNSTKTDNYSTKGNLNPYTGEAGKVEPSTMTNSSSFAAPSVAPLRVASPSPYVIPKESGYRASALPRSSGSSLASMRRREAIEGQERSRAMRSAFQHKSPCPSTGRATGACPGYVVDHVVPLCAKGGDVPSNMQWQSVSDAKRKDVVERGRCARR